MLNQEKEVTLEFYNLLSVEQRKEVYKAWLISEGYSSASAYVNFFPGDIKKSHGIDVFNFTLQEILLQSLPVETLNINNDKKKTSNCKSAYKNYRFFLGLLKVGKLNFEKNTYIKTNF